MMNPNDLENLKPEILKSLLEPLFTDFQHWFNRAQSTLESRSFVFLSATEQANLLQKVKKAAKEVSAAQALFSATDGKAGVDTKVIMEWHQLVTQCWQLMIKARHSET